MRCTLHHTNSKTGESVDPTDYFDLKDAVDETDSVSMLNRPGVKTFTAVPGG